MNEWILAGTIFATLFCWLYTISVKDKQFAEEREKWAKERKDLMDRVQAPSFAEYTNKVVREKKAEQPQEEVKPIEFIS